jgi:hypothetical protein
MKRFAGALAAIGLTTSLGVYAALPTGAQATEVNVPQNEGGLFIGASALYWQPSVSGNDLDYAISQSGGNNTNQQIHNINPDYGWGFNVFTGYNFGDGTDFILEYLQLRTYTNSTTNAPPGGSVVPAHYFATNSALVYQNSQSGVLNQNNYDTYQSAYSNVQINLEQGDLTVGQYINIGCADQLRLFAGLRYAQLEHDLTSNYSQNPTNAGNTYLGSGVTTSSINITNGLGVIPVTTSHGALQAEDDSTFKGMGPVLGLSNTYYLGYGIGFIAGFDLGLLIGDVEDNLTLTNYQAGITTTVNDLGVLASSTANGTENVTAVTVSNSDARRVAPVLDAKLGFDYTYSMQERGSLTLEIGWNISHYWNVVDGVNAGASDADLVSTSATPATNGLTLVSGTTNVTPGHRSNSLGYQGPYVTLTYRSTPEVIDLF